MSASLSKLNEFILPLGFIGCLLVFLVPLPPSVMDLLLSANIAVGLVVLLTTMYVRTPLEFSVFPTVLLATTLARLVLNVATTRLILTQADVVGLSAAGNVIRQFGQYVSGDRLIVGLVIFAIIFVIQMLVITKGATRISEVAARFALDGIPGRQMAIDADLGAGVIDQQQAHQRREDLHREADFYGAMDGASKFVRGDAIAGVVITLINIVGGLAIGLGSGTMTLAEAAEVYSKLTIGDGLASQIPALLISLAAGLLVTRSSQATNLPVEFLRQLFSKPQVMVVAGGFLGLLVFTRLPALPLVLLASAFLGVAWWSYRHAPVEAPKRERKVPSKRRTTPEKAKSVEDYLQVDMLELELGLSLVGIANTARGGDLMQRITKLRQDIASDLGLVLPSVRVRDNLHLPEDQYAIKLAGNVVAQGKIPSEGVVMVPPSAAKTRVIPGAVAFEHPALGRKARLIPMDRVGDAKAAGCQVLSTGALVAEHLAYVINDLSQELLTRDATQQLVDEVRKTSPAVVEELLPHVLKLSEIQQVLRGLLRERIPIRQLSTILETLADHAATTRDPVRLTEIVRKRLARTISARYRDAEGRLHVVTLDPRLEHQMTRHHADHQMGLSAPQTTMLQQILRGSLEKLLAENRPPILLTKSDLRLTLRQLARAVMPSVIVLGDDEVTADSQVRSVGIVGLS